MTVFPRGLDFRGRVVCSRRLAGMGIPRYIGTCPWTAHRSRAVPHFTRASALAYATRRSRLSGASAMACTQHESGTGPEIAHEKDSDAKCIQNSTSNTYGGLSIIDSHLLAWSLERSLSISNVDWPNRRI